MSDEFHADVRDPHAGHGGAYLMKDGKRVRVEEPTKDHPDGNRPRDAEGRPIDAAPEPAKPAPPTPRGPRRLTPVDE